jgi:phosphonate transport system permease protein
VSAIGTGEPQGTPRGLRDPAAPGRLAALLLFLALLLGMLHLTEFDPRLLFDSRNQRILGDFVASFLPPATDATFLALVLRETWRTVAIATCGLALAWVIALPAALLLTRVLSVSALGQSTGTSSRLPRALRSAVRLTLVVLRSVPELVWALLLVRVVGLGPAAGVLAIAITYAGMLGKVYAEIFESVEAAPVLSLLHQGASRLQALVYALLPQCSDELISYTVYRWECALRSSVVLGFVGAGGLGQQLELSMKMFAGGEVATLLLVLVMLVALADAGSALLRRAWA